MAIAAQTGRQRKATTRVNLPTNFVARANQRPVHAMLYMMVEAHGFTITDGLRMIVHALRQGHWGFLALCYAAGPQVRGNVTALPTDTFHISTDYKKLLIRGRSDQPDEYNFTGLHITGQILCHLASDCIWSEANLKKAGDCIFGQYLNDNKGNPEAVAINKATYESWTEEEKTMLRNWINEHPGICTRLEDFFDASQAFHDQFAAYLEDEAAAPTGSIQNAVQTMALVVGNAGAAGTVVIEDVE